MRKLTHEKQVAAIAKVNPDVEVLSEIIHCRTKVLCRCKVCGHEWSARPDSLKSGHGCPKCHGGVNLTHEKQVAAIAKVNPDVEVLVEIVNSTTKVLCRCKVCGHEWSARPDSLKSGHGCPKCGRLRSEQSRRLTHEEQIAAIAKVNPDVEVLGEIISDKAKTLCRCKVCNHEWSATPGNLKSGCGCPKCHGGVNLTHEEQVAAIAKVNPDVEVLGEITGSLKKVLCRCRVCNHEWSPTPSSLKSGCGCPKCGILKVTQAKTLSHEEQVAAIAKVNPDVEVMGEITGSLKKVLCRCKVCDHEWMGIPNGLKSGRGCPKCGRLRSEQSKRLTHEEQIAAIAKVNPDVEVLGEITGSLKKVLCRCKVCDHEWMGIPNGLKSGCGCPKCAKHGFLSHDYGKLYIMVDDLEVPTQMKIGVSIKENERRNQILKSAHKAGVRLPDLHIVKTLEGPTEKIFEIENAMHKVFSNYKINFPVKFDGSNEFFYYRPEVFDMAEETYKEIVCCN